MRFKSLFSRYKNLLPLLVLSVYELWNIYTLFFSTYSIEGIEFELVFTVSHYIGLIGLLLSFAAWHWWKPYFMYVAGAMLVLGIFNLASFTPETITQGYFVKMGGLQLSVRFQPLSLVMIVFYILLNLDFFTPKDVPGQESIALPLDAKKVEEFKTKYQNFSAEELTVIVQEKRFIREAIQAATDLLDSKHKI